MSSQAVRKTLAAIALAAFCAVPVASMMYVQHRKSIDALPIGTAMPPLSGKFLDGGTFSRDTVSAKKLLLIFVSANCPHCRRAISNYDSLFRKYAGKLDVVAVSLGDSGSTALLKRELQLSLPMISGNAFDLARKFKIAVVPAVYCLDESRVVRCYSTGEHSFTFDEEFIKGFIAP